MRGGCDALSLCGCGASTWMEATSPPTLLWRLFLRTFPLTYYIGITCPTIVEECYTNCTPTGCRRRPLRRPSTAITTSYLLCRPPTLYSPRQQPMNIEYYGYAIPTPSPTRTPSIGSSTLHPHPRRPRSAKQQSHHRSRIVVIVMIWSALLHCRLTAHRQSSSYPCHR